MDTIKKSLEHLCTLNSGNVNNNTIKKEKPNWWKTKIQTLGNLNALGQY